ncbi:VWA domain-containing protein [Streptomyces sp. NPDC032940]|uniref:VWA domain-containing protein n=1 Tax=Streptomyces sp. NPDC032940 TaxID=3155366 RepID=UPI0033EAE839
MGILTLLRNAFGRSRKERTAQAEGATQETAPPVTAPEPKLPSQPTAPEEPAETTQVPEPRIDEHELVKAAFTNVTIPAQTDSPETEAKPKAEPQAGAEPKPEAEPKAEPKPEPQAEAEPKPEAEPKAEPKPEPQAEAEPEPEAESKAEAEGEPETKPDTKPEPKAEVEAKPVTKAEPESEAEPETKPEPEPELESQATTEPKAEPKAEPEPQAATPEPEPQAATPEPAAADGEDAPQGPPAPDSETGTGGAGGNKNAEGEAEASHPQPEATPHPEPEPEPEAEPEPEPEAEPATPATPAARLRGTTLTTAYKAAGTALKKHTLTGTRAKVYLVLDRSASMRPYYKDGSAQALAEQTLALAAHLDADPTLHVTFFSTDVDGTGALTLRDHENKIDELHAALGRMGRTSYHAAVEAVLARHDKEETSGTRTPALVVFQTDGAPDAKTPATKALTDAAASHPHVHFSFVAFGDPENKAFDYLRKLKTPNASHFLAGETPKELTDKELYEGVLAGWRP